MASNLSYESLTTSRLKLDVRDEIAWKYADEAPFTTLLMNMKGKKTGTSYKREWLEGDYESLDDTLGASYTTGDTQITVSNGSRFNVNDVIKDTDAGNVFLVTAVSSNTLTVTYCGSGSIAASSATDNNIMIIGSAFSIGEARAEALSTALTNKYNYMQIFKTAFEVPNSVIASALNGGDELKRLTVQKLWTHKLKIERSFWFGELKQLTSGGTGSNYEYFMKGVYKFQGSSNATNISDGVLTEADFWDWIRSLDSGVAGDRYIFASPIITAGISQWGLGKLEINSSATKESGINIKVYHTPFGDFNIVNTPLFKNDYSGYAFAISLNNLNYVAMANDDKGTRDGRLETHIEDEGDDSRMDQYLSEITIEYRNPDKDGYLYGVSSIG